MKQINARAKEGELSLKYKIQKLPPYVSIFILSCCNSACSCSAFLIGVICSRRPGALNSRHNARCRSLPLCRYYRRQQRAICDIYIIDPSPHIHLTYIFNLALCEATLLKYSVAWQRVKEATHRPNQLFFFFIPHFIRILFLFFLAFLIFSLHFPYFFFFPSSF